MRNLSTYLSAPTLHRRAWLALSFGSLASLAFAPVGFFPILWLSFPALIFLLRETKGFWDAFLTGWSFAFGLFVFSLYWIAESMFVDLASFWWAIPLAVLGLPAFLALYYGLAAGLARKVGVEGVAGCVTLALFWFLADFARGHLLTGFPWNLIGQAWVHVLPVLQSVSLFGIYGLTLVTLVCACLSAGLFKKVRQPRESGRDGYFYVVTGLLFFAALAAWGGLRLHAATHDIVPNMRLRLVMPNTDQAHKWISNEREAHFEKLLAYSAARSVPPVTTVIWPETAPAFLLTEDTAHRAEAAAAIPENGTLLTGVIRRDAEDRYYNSLIALDRSGRVITTYDKAHLVPFGEYIPFRKWIPLRALSSLGMDFDSGTGPQTLHLPDMPSFSPLICYEAIFSGKVARRDDRPHFLLNVTNDGWFGATAGPYQHFAIARTRAIEEGLPLVRVANQGVTAVTDAYGQIVVARDRDVEGAVDSDLPVSIPPTVFSRYGDKILWGMFGVLALSVIMVRGRNRFRPTGGNGKRA